MKTDVQQRMVDHMLETSKLMNGNETVIFLSSDSEEEESGSVIDLTEMVKVKWSQGQKGVVVNDLILSSTEDVDNVLGSESASSVTGEGTVALESGGEEANVILTQSKDIDADLISSPSRSPNPSTVLASIQRSPVDHSTSENQVSSSKLIHSTSETSKGVLSEDMTDVIQDVIQDESLSSHHSQMDLCDETNVLTGEEKKDTNNNPEENIEIMTNYGKMKDNPDLLWSEDSMYEVRKRLRSDEECEENTDESLGPSAKRILLLANKSREEEERSEDDRQENEGRNQDEDSDSFFPREFSDGNTDSDKRNEDPVDTSNGEAVLSIIKQKSVQYEDELDRVLDTDVFAVR